MRDAIEELSEVLLPGVVDEVKAELQGEKQEGLQHAMIDSGEEEDIRGVCCDCHDAHPVRYVAGLRTEPEDEEMGPEGDYVMCIHSDIGTIEPCAGVGTIPQALIIPKGK